ncbi:MAG: flippase-like domain-containing protein, partial [Ignavibacteriaceae bacterium]|nr:flippase-like domain-containing protein [Ignavibacteriaceae bacterium]
DFDDLTEVLSSFKWWVFPLLLLLSFLNYVSRFFKWQYYLTLLKVSISKVDSFSIFMSGLVMSVTPGKMGELLKSYLVKQITGTPISRTAPIILAERITDFISLVLIGIIGAYIYDYGRSIVIGVGIFFLIVVVIISNKTIALSIIKQFEKISFLKKYLHNINSAYESSYLLLRPIPLFYMTILSFISWSFECLGYHLILINFSMSLSYLWASFSYAFATIVGAISMLPGGLGLTEGSLTYMLIKKSYSKEIAVASTFIIRIVTLWFAVFVGIISVSLYQKRFGKLTDENLINFGETNE